MELARQLSSVVLVLALLGLALWWLKKKSLVRIGAGIRRKRKQARLESVERLSLSPQHSLHLVRMADRALLVAVHASGCSLLETRPWDEVENRTEGAPVAASAAGTGR
jgi:flagellar biogenesis protein FliO